MPRLINRPTEEEKERIRQILGDWISDSEGEDASEIRKRDEKVVNYLIDNENIEIERSKTK